MKRENIFRNGLPILLFVTLVLSVQTGMSQTLFPWPMQPFNQSQWITGTFCEYRSTTTPGHFHNGTDIPNADGTPVYPCTDGVVVSMATSGSNAYIRIGDKAYVHIQPNPSLSVGDHVYASQTVIGHILSGLGHVHFTYGYYGSEHNAMLVNDGLNPLVDNWAPIIRFVKFYVNNTTTELPANGLFGFVDIIVKVDEQNGDPSTPVSVRNNGTYKIGYRIYSADTSTVVYEPPYNGLRFVFNNKPSNSYVDIVYFQPMSSTTSHVYQVTNDIWQDNYWDTSQLPQGDYVVQIFTEDTRFNADTAYVPVTITAVDTVAPVQPQFKFVKGTDTGLHLSWVANPDSDLVGYRLYFSFDNQLWTLFKDESELTSAVTDTVLPMVLNTSVYFRLTAVDNSPITNESQPSDVYGTSNGSGFLGKVLIVNGFSRSDGDWPSVYHPFNFTYGQAVLGNQISFDTAPETSIANGTVSLNDYDAVIWYTGDDSCATAVFDSAMQVAVRQYLENGGQLLVSGSSVARALDPDGSASATPQDEQFLHDYLHVDFVGRTHLHALTGLENSILSGLNFDFSTANYFVDSSDVVVPYGNGAVASAQYGLDQYAAVQYEGLFGSSSTPGKVVVFSFPFETVSDAQTRVQVMGRVLSFFLGINALEPDGVTGKPLPADFTLLPNYPNPFNPETNLRYVLPMSAQVILEIYNTLGQKVRSLIHEPQSAGSYEVRWNGLDDRGQPVASGVYLVRFRAVAHTSGDTRRVVRTEKIVLTR